MAASRPSSVRILNALTSASKQRRRSLHMTGPATFPSAFLIPAERTATNVAKDLTESIKRPEASEQPALSTSSIKGRHFNTSRALKAHNDSSTVDFAYLPMLVEEPPSTTIRVPLLPTNFFPPRTGTHAPEVDDGPVMRPTISTASLDSTHISAPSAFAEVHDNSAMQIDFHAMADKVTSTVKKVADAEPAEKVGIVKEFWNGFLDDVFGAKQKKSG